MKEAIIEVRHSEQGESTGACGQQLSQRITDKLAVEEEPDFKSLDYEFDRAIDVARGVGGTFYLQTNSPEGHACARFWMHPYMAVKLRDWLNENYPE